MRLHGNEVCEVKRTLAARFDQNALMRGCMPGGRDKPNTLGDFLLTLHKLDLTGSFERRVVTLEVACRRALVWMRSVIVFPMLHDVPRFGERRLEVALRVDIGVTACVVEVEMGVYHNI